ncbi:metal tolerance protein 2 [Dorcoceras hygrometricum]|uniref:Metal tolerance protein 2 n=1 Tax=Dorcoceras hygrometricum TaxID=472368 RepID=A0A2Z6ZSM6_9LAMI|nr:metal tolerance protein 2 [Dorcoceras hygrometricum]
MRAGRAWWLGAALHDAQALRMRRPRASATPQVRDASLDASGANCCAAGRSVTGDARRRFTRGRPTIIASSIECWPDEASQGVARWLGVVVRRWRAIVAGRARRCAARFFLMAAAAGRSPLRRCSDDIVTAGVISSRVWFGPVPGSP